MIGYPVKCFRQKMNQELIYGGREAIGRLAGAATSFRETQESVDQVPVNRQV
jgi:hypothetical protein